MNRIIQPELEEPNLPRCSAIEALDRQEPFVNPTLANHALALLARLFRYGTISYHGAFVALGSISGVQPLRVDPKVWRRLRQKRTSGMVQRNVLGPAGSESPSRQSR